MKCGPSNDRKVVDRLSFQNFGKLMKPFGNMSFPISFQMFNVIGNPNIFCSVNMSLLWANYRIHHYIRYSHDTKQYTHVNVVGLIFASRLVN